jgi:hypothetical protein
MTRHQLANPVAHRTLDRLARNFRGSLVAVIAAGAVVMLAAPGSEQWRFVGFAAVIALALGKFVVELHREIVDGAASLGWPSARCRAAIWLPIAAASALVMFTVAGAVEREGPGFGELALAAVAEWAGLYAMTGLLVRGIIAAVVQPRPSGHRAPAGGRQDTSIPRKVLVA